MYYMWYDAHPTPERSCSQEFTSASILVSSPPFIYILHHSESLLCLPLCPATDSTFNLNLIFHFHLWNFFHLICVFFFFKTNHSFSLLRAVIPSLSVWYLVLTHGCNTKTTHIPFPWSHGPTHARHPCVLYPLLYQGLSEEVTGRDGLRGIRQTATQRYRMRRNLYPCDS